MAIKSAFRPPFRYKAILKQMENIGTDSLPIIILTAIFSGAVLTLESGQMLYRFRTETVVGSLVSLSFTRQMAPVLAALMIIARSGSAMAAQLGTMRVTGQIDAIEAMAVDPLQLLVFPRIIACILILPIQTIVYDFFGMLGSYITGVKVLGISEAFYFYFIQLYTDFGDITMGLYKATWFGLILSCIACYCGFHSENGALGVGRSTTKAVVASSAAILVANYFLTALQT
jgi:phospholipid/cholesterol/gamma-HCH transport system permease protein